MAKSELTDSDNSSSDEFPEGITTEDELELGAIATVSDSSVVFADEENAIALPTQISSRNSVVIQSLIKFMCKAYKSSEAKYREFCEILNRMMIIDHSFQMVEFEGLRMQYEGIFQQIFSSAPGTRSGAVTPVIDSHYAREFEEKEFIARGGFGKVFKVRHRLDGTEYAIKKICIRKSSIKPIQDCLAEVKTFASMNHPNIVQYKGAWIEMDTRNECDTDTDTDSEDEGDDDDSFGRDTFASNGSASTDFNIYFETSRHHSLSTSRDKKAKHRIKRNSASEGGDAICKVEEIKRLQGTQAKGALTWATLYIQMTLCHSTLKEWLEDRNVKESSCVNSVVPVCDPIRARTVIGICRQILSGIDYMHAKQMVHHDIKPSNIFILHDMQTSTLIQLGDFGLACPKSALKHQIARGTQLYAAPEQLAGVCDAKSDMYSLGIVILELTEGFSTNMERVEYIRHLRNGKVPKMTRKHQPLLAETMSRLVARDPASRPDAATLLKELKLEESKEDKDNLIARQAKELQEMRLRIAELEQELLRTKEITGDRS